MKTTRKPREEEWRPILLGYYEVSSLGRVRRSVIRVGDFSEEG